MSFLHLSVRFLLTGTPISNAVNRKDGRCLLELEGRGLWGELAQWLWTGGPTTILLCLPRDLATWLHPQLGGRGAELSHLPCSQTFPVPSPGDMLIPAPSPGQGLPVDLLSELDLGSAFPAVHGTHKGNRNGMKLQFSVNEEGIRAGKAAYKMPNRPFRASLGIKPRSLRRRRCLSMGWSRKRAAGKI